MKVCSKCQEKKPLSEFYRMKDRWQGYCKVCHRTNKREDYQKNSPKHRNKRHERYDSERKRLEHIKHLYGLSSDDYKELLAKQNNVCAICESECRVQKRLSVDHCHVTGTVRGLLCSHCNTAIGKLKDSPDLLRKAALYLENHYQNLTT